MVSCKNYYYYYLFFYFKPQDTQVAELNKAKTVKSNLAFIKILFLRIKY